MAADAFAVLREGMQGKAGIGKLALSGREYLVAVQPREQGMVMYNAAPRQGSAEHGTASTNWPRCPRPVKADEVKLAKQVIGNFEGDLDLSEFRDEYQAELRRIIDAKIAGDEVVMPAEEAPTKVVNLMDALRKSLDSVSRAKKPPAKAKMAKGATRATARTTQKRKRA